MLWPVVAAATLARSAPAQTQNVLPAQPLSAPAPLPPEDPAPFAPGEERQMGKHPVDPSKLVEDPGTGFVFKTVDGEFSLAPRLRAQFLYTLQDEEGADARQSFQIRRARLQFKGNFFGPDNKYKVELAFSPGDVGMSDGEAPATSILLDWYLDFVQLRDLTLRVGQYKIPHTRQRVVSSGDLELVDRSIVNAEFNLDRDIGFDLRSEDLFGLDLLRYYLGLYAGEGRNTRGSYDLGMLYLARVEVLPLGGFEDYQEGDFERLGSPKLSVGVGVAHLRNARGNQGILGSAPSDGGTTDINSFTADAVFRYAGFSLTTEWALRNGTRAPGAEGELEPPREGYGGMLQASYLFPRTRFGVAARAAFIEPLGGDTSLAATREYGGGLNYYFGQHPFKLQADYFRLGEETGGADVYADQVRLQLQASL